MAEPRIDEAGLPVYAPGDYDFVRVVDASTGASRNALSPEVTAAARALTLALDGLVADAREDIDAIIRDLGYLAPVPYASGLNVNDIKFTVSYNGDVYAPKPELVPFTTGAWNPAQWNVIQGDINLRSDLSDPTGGAGLVAFRQAGAGATLRTAADKLRDVVSAHDFGAVGDGVTDDTLAIQTAITYCIQNGKSLYVPGGVYIVRPHTHGYIYLNNLTAHGQGLTMYGDGRGKTIFREGSGETAAGGRFTTMFYCWLDDPASRMFRYGSFTFRDMTFDKNGRSNGTEPSPYAWEGAHIIKFQGAAGTPSIDAITFERIELVDKIGCGIAVGPTDVVCRSLTLKDIQSREHPSVANGNFSRKGCIEVAIDSDLTVFDGVNCQYSQIERTDAYDPARVMRFKGKDSNVDVFEYTYGGASSGVNEGNSNIFIEVSGMTCLENFVVRGVRIKVSNSTLVCKLDMYPLEMVAEGCTFRLPYSVATGDVTPVYIARPTAYTVAPRAKFIGCDFLIDAASVTPAADSFLFRSTNQPSNSADILFHGCYFDPRAYGVCSPYLHGGRYTFDACRMAANASGRAVDAGTYSTFTSSVRLLNCDFSNVDGDWLYIRPAVANYHVTVTGDYSASAWRANSNNAPNVLPEQYVGRPRLTGNAPPTTGKWFVGDRIYRATPAAGGSEGWVCTATAGGASVGTWKEFGSVAA